MCVNVSFSENFANILNEWPLCYASERRTLHASSIDNNTQELFKVKKFYAKTKTELSWRLKFLYAVQSFNFKSKYMTFFAYKTCYDSLSPLYFSNHWNTASGTEAKVSLTLAKVSLLKMSLSIIKRSGITQKIPKVCLWFTISLLCMFLRWDDVTFVGTTSNYSKLRIFIGLWKMI